MKGTFITTKVFWSKHLRISKDKLKSEGQTGLSVADLTVID